MPIRVTAESGRVLAEVLADLLAREPYLAYANFKPIAAGPLGAVGLHARRWHEAAAGLGALVARDHRERPLATLYLEHRGFESQHFEMAMARVSPVAAVAEEDQRLPALRGLFAATAKILRENGYDHLTAEVSAHDRIACWTLQEIGAFHVGTRISWMQELTGRPSDHSLGPHLRIETYDRAALKRLHPGTWSRLVEWAGTAFDRGPYVFDLGVPHEQARRVYQVWTEKALRGEWAEFVLAVFDGDEMVSFHTMNLLPDLSEAAGVGIVGRGIGGTLPGYPGLFTALQKETSATRPLGAAYLENEAQASTLQSINVFGKLGHFCHRSVATFHMRLDGDRAGRRRIGDPDQPQFSIRQKALPQRHRGHRESKV